MQIIVKCVYKISVTIMTFVGQFVCRISLLEAAIRTWNKNFLDAFYLIVSQLPSDGTFTLVHLADTLIQRNLHCIESVHLY